MVETWGFPQWRQRRLRFFFPLLGLFQEDLVSAATALFVFPMEAKKAEKQQTEVRGIGILSSFHGAGMCECSWGSPVVKGCQYVCMHSTMAGSFLVHMHA
ncbi:uncharacterized protein B0I36DRAFT_333482 [Microdochium trichocladiopsis]|uniref:Uncharacterized protein n=1 Tax=Microdochium trichocladiopsis TaxID=1682393 RepID=A0A9P8XVI8_9PEZI|nr:uncharacterized protein B0I36DRAFT_333482 [Microdochium trichocladiopsis]KAH7020943.1 hypothetical protein B0I36DRAFT_333482 [Microdochium trichocladiopsis]